MKYFLTLLVTIAFLTSSVFAQEAARKPVRDTSDIHSAKPIATSETHPQSTTETQVNNDTQTPTQQDAQFSMAGLLVGSLQNWNDLQTDKSKLGFGMSGDLFAGVLFDDMYIGLGPHLGYNFWTFSENVLGVSASSTTSVSDFGIDLGATWEGFFVTIGAGSSNVSITAEAGGSSTTVDIPNSIGYKRVSLGWNDGYAFGIAFMTYNNEDLPNNLNRVEFNIGWAF